ncbi:hypothetical protein B0A49_00350 [Cryomyces minteri]|uniref:PX domain-containing protein n=1 Tax=Cryomyces minteri TaxID=331657 RepID=A0A4U0XZV8_9PEZI|nr:hypothetical protein B0A49_00350 [Cryomyces minteri]
MAPTLEISIPTTQTSNTTKPYTMYNISLRLPLRTYVVAKRYSDFLTLHSTLTSQTGLAPPVSPPAKSWFARTVNNAQLTEQRRATLEAYLGAINTAEDGRWRACSAWRAFLNLPSSSSSNNTAGGNNNSSSSSTAAAHSVLTTPGQAGNAPIADPAVWLDVHRELKTQLRDARLYLTRRDQAASAAAQHEASAGAKKCLVRAASLIAALDDGLARLSSASNNAGRGGGGGRAGRTRQNDDDDDDEAWNARLKLGDGEVRRRRDLLGAARKEREGLEGVLSSMATKNSSGGAAAATAGDKSELWRHTTTSTSSASSNLAPTARRVLGGRAPETARTRELDNAGILQLQQQILAEQDDDVLDLGRVVRRMKEMGIQINDELAVQNQLLDLLDDDATRVADKIGVAKKRIKKIS